MIVGHLLILALGLLLHSVNNEPVQKQEETKIVVVERIEK